MASNIFFSLFYICNVISLINTSYPPIGNEVQPGSVLLPASRRGRYLANIVRRQAVDGTGIKFNKDADRINAESKKKVDVLSEELLPYIIAEQERRTTLYKRIMTAIQNGEKGVTIAEIRNKPPAIIRKGLMYRCPTNRVPKEPDGSGIIMCDGDIDPSPIMYESCLSAEDKELYVAENRFFFCNRHRVEGPDLPRNGSTVIGCAPIERTSLNYTSLKCALEDSEDVVVHYRYYPDRTYKFVTELDPDREICDHWNPCQVGYIYSLPSPDQATQSSELWHDYQENFEDFERDEIIPPIPEDSLIEDTVPSPSYRTSTRRVPLQPGYNYHGVGKYVNDGEKKRISLFGRGRYIDTIEVTEREDSKFLYITITFAPLFVQDAGTYYVRFQKKDKHDEFKEIPFLTISIGRTKVQPLDIVLLPGQRVNSTIINYNCNICIVRGVMFRAEDGQVDNLEPSKYKVKRANEQSYIEIDFGDVLPKDFGDYFILLENQGGLEERVKALSINAPLKDTENEFQFKRIQDSGGVDEHFDRTVNYTCEDCELTDVLCHGESTLAGGRVTVITASKIVNFNFLGFDDANSCVYMGIFKKGNFIYTKVLAVIENNAPSVKINHVPIVPPPEIGEPFEHSVQYTCDVDCIIDKIYVNSIPLEKTTRRSGRAVAFYITSGNTITVRISKYSTMYEGVFQAIFLAEGMSVTKTIMEIGDKKEEVKPETTTEANAEPAEETKAQHSTSTTEAAANPGADSANEQSKDKNDVANTEITSPEEKVTKPPPPPPPP